MYDNIEKFLRINNYFNFEGPCMNYTGEKNVEQDTNYIISKTISRFISTYKPIISKHPTFVLKYDNDLYSYIAFKIVHAASVCMHRVFDIRILGDLNAEEQKLFKEFKTISYRNAKKLKNCILITGFNPIFNVDCEGDVSKVFIEICRPIERFSPITIYTAMNFYLDKNSFLYDEEINPEGTGMEEQNPMWWSEIVDDDESFKVDLEKDKPNVGLIGYYCSPTAEEIYKKVDKTVPIVHFILNGNEDDFPMYEFILNSSKEGNIHVYTIINGRKGYEFTRLNLGTYIDYRNCPRPINTVFTRDGWDDFMYEKKEENIYSFLDFMKEENDESSSS